MHRSQKLQAIFLIVSVLITAAACLRAEVIQGFKVVAQGQSLDSGPGPDFNAMAGQSVTLDGADSQTANPYFFTSAAPGPHTVAVSAPAGWSVAYSLGIDASYQPSPLTAVPGSSVSFDLPVGATYNLWWWYTPPTGRIQGYKIDANGVPFAGAQTTVIAGTNFYTGNPYTAQLPAGTYRIVTTVPDGYTASYSLCNDCIDHPAASFMPGNIVQVTVTGGGYVDLYWRYTASVPLAPFFRIADPPATQQFSFGYAPAIVQQNGTTHVFFCSSVDGAANRGAVRYTNSTDGVHWSSPLPLIQANGTTTRDLDACDPSVVYYKGPHDAQAYYYLYYSSVYIPQGNNLTEVQVARSANIAGPYLIYTQSGNWVTTPTVADPPKIIVAPKNPAVPAAQPQQPGYYGAGQQEVIVHDNQLYMWYIDDTVKGVPSYGQSYFMQSADPVQWNYPTSVPLVIPGVPSGFFGGNPSPDIKFDPISNKFVMVDIQNNQTPISSLATTTSTDGVNWTAYQTVIPASQFPHFAHNVGFSGDATGNMPAGPSIIGFGAPYDPRETTSQTVNFWDVYGVSLDIHPALAVSFDITLHDPATDTNVNAVTWPAVALPTGFVRAGAYIQLNSTITTPTGGIQIYTTNTAASALPKYTGPANPAGLVDAANPQETLPLAWSIKDSNTMPPVAADPNGPSTPTSQQWLTLKDQASPTFVNGADNVTLRRNGTLNAAQPGLFQSCTTPDFIYLETDFSNARYPDSYATNSITIEAYTP